MGEPVKPTAPVTVEVSDDQNTATVTTNIEFVSHTETYHCNPCAADERHELCKMLPCGNGLHFRADGRIGYFREVRG
jgi:hypothetical protein